MANTIDIVVQAHDRASKQLAAVGNRAERLGDKLRKMRGPLLGVTAAVGGLGFFAVKTFANFEQQMARAGAVSKATSDELIALTDIAKEMGRTTKFTASQSAEALTFMAMAGMDVKTQLEALPRVLELAAAGSLDLGQAADIVTNVMAGFGLQAGELAMANDVLTTAFTNANTDLVELGSAFKMAGPVAKAAGQSFIETTAALAMMGNAGIKGTMAGTSLRGAMTRLLNPATEAAKIINKLGLNVQNADGSLVSIVDIIKQLETSGMTAGEAMTIFGQRAGPAMLALVSEGSGALEELTTKMEESAGVTKNIMDKQMDTLAGTLTELKSAVEGVMIEIGSALSPTLRSVAGVLQKVASVIAGLNPFVLKMGVGVIALVGAFALLGLAIPPIIAGFTLMAMTPVGLVITAIALALAGLAFLFIKHKETIRDFAIKMVDVLGAGAIAVAEIFDSIGLSVTRTLGKVIGKFADLAGALGMGKLSADLNKWSQDVAQFSLHARDKVEDVVNRLTDMVARTEQEAQGSFEQTEQQAKKTTDTIITGLERTETQAERTTSAVNDLTTSLATARSVGGSSAYGPMFAHPSLGYSSTFAGPGAGFMGKTNEELINWVNQANFATGDPTIGQGVQHFNQWESQPIVVHIDGKEVASAIDPHNGDNANTESNNRS